MDEPINIQTYDSSLKRRLTTFSKEHPNLCTLERTNELGGVFYQVEMSRLSLRLIAPYSEERRKTASEQAK